MSFSELIDRAIVYGGGGGVVVSSQALQAQSLPEKISLMQYPLPGIEITIGDACTIIATLVVIGKGCLDYLTYRDRKRGGK